MADPRDMNLPWPFRPCDRDPYINVEIAPNEWVRVVLAGTFDQLESSHYQLMIEHQRLREAAQAQIEAANAAINLWHQYGRVGNGG